MTFRKSFIALGALVTFGWAAPAAAQSITLTGDEAPSVQPWTEPASVSYVDSSEDTEDRVAVDAALKVSWRAWDTNTFFLRGVAHLSDQSKKEQEIYKLSGGMHFETDIGVGDNALSLFTDVSLGWASKATFGDPTSPTCVATPALAACGTQRQRSIRFIADFQPWLPGWERTYTVDRTGRTGDQWAYSFAPQLVLFHDEVTEAVLNTAGQEEDGGVTGAKIMLAFAISPPILDHRLNIRTSFQQIQTFDRSEAREASFSSSTNLFRASVDYELGARSWDTAGGWAPSIGVTYASGEDPLDGRKDKDDVTIGFRLTYRSPL